MADSWFYGKVPRFLLDQKTAELNGVPYVAPTAPASEWDPVVIRSKHAEIIYFASPEYDLSVTDKTDPDYWNYVDVDGDSNFVGTSSAENGIPDRIKIHRRVLLIRPDLNLSNGTLNDPPVAIGGDTPPDLLAQAWTTSSTDNTWLHGMAQVHQHCDLSVRRLLGPTTRTLVDGIPAQEIAANSLADLSQPHNRFAHVRVPRDILGAGLVGWTSMPLLALHDKATILDATTVAASVDLAPAPTPDVGPVVRPGTLSSGFQGTLTGFLRREFVLGQDFVHADLDGRWGTARLGEDVLTNNAIAFDLRIFDSFASYFTTSNNLVVGPGDAGYREALIEKLADLAASPTPVIRESTQGGFVDLCYPVLAGGSLRGWQARRHDRLDGDSSDDSTIGTNQGFLITPFSGVRAYGAADDSLTSYQSSLYRSGRLVCSDAGASPNIMLFQPAFDTYTNRYEIDGFRQDYRTIPTFPWVAAPTENLRGTNWTDEATDVDTGADGLDNNGVFGADDASERETSPPFITRPEAIRISIRIENPTTRQIRQASVVHRDQL